MIYRTICIMHTKLRYSVLVALVSLYFIRKFLQSKSLKKCKLYKFFYSVLAFTKPNKRLCCNVLWLPMLFFLKNHDSGKVSSDDKRNQNSNRIYSIAILFNYSSKNTQCRTSYESLLLPTKSCVFN